MSDDDPPLLRLGEQLRQLLSAFPRIKTAVLFGSCARGTASPASDLDLAVDAGQPLDQALRVELIEQLALAFGRPVDLVDLQTVGEPLLGQIVSTGYRVLGSNSDWGGWIYRNIIENEDFVPLQRRILRERRQAWIDS